VAVILYLAEHNLAFKGSSDVLNSSHNGNFLSLIELLAKFDPVLRDHINRAVENKTSQRNKHYLSRTFQNRIINAMGNKVKKTIIEKIKKAKYYAILLDCTPDISHQEQLSIVLRFVDVTNNDVEIKEHFIKFEVVNDTTGRGLYEKINAILTDEGLKLSDCRGQGYDNGANMKGTYHGVQANILRENKKAFYVSCASHNLNLVLGDIAKSSSKAVHFFGTLQKIYTTFAGSTSRWSILKQYVTSLTPKPLSETRWECRIDSVKAIRFQIPNFRDALNALANHDNKLKAETLALIKHITKFEFLVSVIIWYDLPAKVNFASKIMQSKTMHIDMARSHLKEVVLFFEEYRNSGMSNAVSKAKEMALELDIEPEFLSSYQGKKRKLFEYEGEDAPTTTAEDNFRINYFLQIIDTAITSLQKRFEIYDKHKNIFGFLYMNELENLNETEILNGCKNLELILEEDIDGIELFEEVKMFKNILPKNYSSSDAIKYIIKNNLSEIYPNLVIGLQILLTAPVTVASAERSFSKLKLIKNYLRSGISQERFSSLAILSIENQIAKSLDYSDICYDLAFKKARNFN
jgi:hypothetical protein